MKITKVEVFPVAIPYPAPYKVARQAKPAQGDVILKVHTDEGIIGLGDTAASSIASGQTLAVLTAVLVNELCPVLIGQDPLQIETLIVQWLGGMDCPWPRALHAIDLALWDIAGKYHKKPIYELLGATASSVRRTMTLSRSLPIKSLEETAERAIALKEQGYKLLTVKVGLNPDEDLKRVKAVYDAVGDSVKIEVDGNESYTLDVAKKNLKQMDGMISSCEQPLPRWDLLGMAELAEALDTAVIADQAVNNARDVATIARMRAADVICLRLLSHGGITLAQKVLTVAQAHGLPCSMGSGHPLGIGTAAIHHFVAANPWVRMPIGYGSPLERLPDDILVNSFEVKNGAVELREGHGLGVELDEDKLKKYAQRITVDYQKPVTVPAAGPQPWLTAI